MRAINLLSLLLQGTPLLFPSPVSAINIPWPLLQLPGQPPNHQDSSLTLGTTTRPSPSPLGVPTPPLPQSEPTLHLPQPTHILRIPVLDLRQDTATLSKPTPAAPPAPGITQAPDANGGTALGAGAGGPETEGLISGIGPDGKPFLFRQTTYYTCITRKATAYCGWHTPVLEVSAGVSERGGRGMMAVVIAGVVAAALVLS